MFTCVFSVRSLGTASALEVLLEQVAQLSSIHGAQGQETKLKMAPGQSSFHKEDQRSVELIKTKSGG